MLSIITGLIVLIVYQNIEVNETVIDESQVSSETKIQSFNASYDDISDTVSLSWYIQDTTKNVETIQVLQNEEVLATLQEESSVVLDVLEHNLSSGNNEFKLLVTLQNQTTLEKTVYVYLNEVTDFNVDTIYEGNQTRLLVTYTYDARKPVLAPLMSVSGSNESFVLTYLNTQIISQNGNQIIAQSEYLLNFANVEVGNYELYFIVDFADYNLEFDFTTTIQVIHVEQSLSNNE